MRAAQPVQHPLIPHHGPHVEPARDEHDVGGGDLGKRMGRHHAHAGVGALRPGLGRGPPKRGAGQEREDLGWAHRIERRHSVEGENRDLHRATSVPRTVAQIVGPCQQRQYLL